MTKATEATTNGAPETVRSKRRSWFWNSVRLLVTVALIVLLLRVVDMRSVGRQMLQLDLGLLAVAVLLALADRALMIGKWYPLLRVQVPSCSLAAAARTYLASGFASIFLPSLGVDVLRGVALGRGHKAVPEVGASIFAERLLGMLGGGVLCLIALVVAVRASIDVSLITPWALISFMGSLAAITVPFVLWSFPVLWERFPPLKLFSAIPLVRRFGKAYFFYRQHLRMVAVVGFLSTLEQLFPIVGLWIIARALGAPIGFEMLIVAAPLTLFAARLPFSLWGLGVTEGAFVYLLGLFGVAPAEAVALSLAGRVVELAALAPGAFLWADLVRSHK